jgi:hypothetical protein
MWLNHSFEASAKPRHTGRELEHPAAREQWCYAAPPFPQGSSCPRAC